MTLDNALLLAGSAAEAAIVAVLLLKRVYRTFPIFSAFIVWSLLSDVGGYILVHRFPNSDMKVYVADTAHRIGISICGSRRTVNVSTSSGSGVTAARCCCGGGCPYGVTLRCRLAFCKDSRV